MSTLFTYVEDLRAAAPPPENGTLSRTMHNDDTVKIIAFGFAAGQELSAHTSPMPAILQFLEGEMEVKLGSETMTAKPGTLIHMTPLLEHSLKATTPSTMVLYLLKNPR
jgi:quercetin dioxygenase-like cupin family protein